MQPIALKAPVGPSGPARRQDVYALKAGLSRIGEYRPRRGIGMTGTLDRDTVEGVKRVQRRFGLPATGTVRPDDGLVDALNSEAARRGKLYRPAISRAFLDRLERDAKPAPLARRPTHTQSIHAKPVHAPPGGTARGRFQPLAPSLKPPAAAPSLLGAKGPGAFVDPAGPLAQAAEGPTDPNAPKPDLLRGKQAQSQVRIRSGGGLRQIIAGGASHLLPQGLPPGRPPPPIHRPVTEQGLHQANIGPDGQPVDPWPTDDPFDILTSPFPRRFPSQGGNHNDDEGDTGQPAKRPTLPDTAGPGGPEPGGPELDPTDLVHFYDFENHDDNVQDLTLDDPINGGGELTVTPKSVNYSYYGGQREASDLFSRLGITNLQLDTQAGDYGISPVYIGRLDLGDGRVATVILRRFAREGEEPTVEVQAYLPDRRKLAFRFRDDPSLPPYPFLED
jgi:hypothetical protein